jgi:hypothetical protein
MRIRIGVIALAAALIGACANPALDADKAANRAKRDEANQTIPKCVGEKDCAAKWDAAQLWIVKNSAMKIQTMSSVVIQTFNAPSNSAAMGMVVTKEPVAGESGAYNILIRMNSGNGATHASDMWDAILAFNRFVSAAKP